MIIGIRLSIKPWMHSFKPEVTGGFNNRGVDLRCGGRVGSSDRVGARGLLLREGPTEDENKGGDEGISNDSSVWGSISMIWMRLYMVIGYGILVQFDFCPYLPPCLCLNRLQ